MTKVYVLFTHHISVPDECDCDIDKITLSKEEAIKWEGSDPHNDRRYEEMELEL